MTTLGPRAGKVMNKNGSQAARLKVVSLGVSFLVAIMMTAWLIALEELLPHVQWEPHVGASFFLVTWLVIFLVLRLIARILNRRQK